MKNFLKLPGIIALVAVIGFSMAACSNGTTGGNKGDETEQPKSRMDNQPVSDLSWGGKVTIKSADKYLDADWETMVADVVAALERGYGKDMGGAVLNEMNEEGFEFAFAVGKNAEVVVVNSGRECEVKTDGKMYLKASTVTTVDVQAGVWAIWGGDPYQSVAKVMPMNKKYFVVLNVVKFV